MNESRTSELQAADSEKIQEESPEETRVWVEVPAAEQPS
jgi:hypothetical protein